MKNELTRLERYRGCLLGLAAGDALGAPLRGMKAGHVRQVYGEIEDYVDAAKAWEGRLHRWVLPGLYTSNTQRALVIADILARDGHCEPRALADVFVEMADAHVPGSACGCHRRVSRNFLGALERMRSATTDPRECGGPSAGCGAAARGAPLGLFYADKPDLLARAVIETSMVTHRDRRAIEAALAVALAVAQAVAGQSGRRLRPAETARVLAEQVRQADMAPSLNRGQQANVTAPSFLPSLELLPRLLEEADDTLAFDSIVREANRCAPDRPIHDPSEGFAPAGVIAALYLALGGRSLPEAVPTVVGLGREAHDLGAIVGAIVGAREGLEAIPGQWLVGLRNADQVRLRADGLASGAIDYSTWRGIVELESEVTATEERERRRLAERWDKEGLLVKKKPRIRPPAQPELGFAPPPELWLRRKLEREQRVRKRRREDRGRKDEF